MYATPRVLDCTFQEFGCVNLSKQTMHKKMKVRNISKQNKKSSNIWSEVSLQNIKLLIIIHMLTNCCYQDDTTRHEALLTERLMTVCWT